MARRRRKPRTPQVATAPGPAAQAPEGDRSTPRFDGPRMDEAESTVFRVAEETIWDMAVLPDGRRVLSGLQGGKAVLSDLATGAPLRTFDTDAVSVRATAPLPDGRRAVLGALGTMTSLWDLETGTRLHQFGRQDERGIALKILPDGKRILVGTHQGSISLYDLESGNELRHFPGHGDYVRCVDIVPGGRWVMSGSDDHAVRLWNLETGAELRQFIAHSDWVVHVAALPDGKRALSASRDGTIRLWDLNTGAELRRFDAAGTVWALTLLPGGKRALSGGGVTIHLWDLETGQELRRYEGHAGVVTAIALLPDGKRFVAADSNGYIRVWRLDEIAAGNQLYTTARVALLGDSGVGKTGLGWRIAHGAFREHPSTHGQQFWVVDSLGDTRADGTQCETVLWDLAGQPDYRLVHALFLDNVDLGLLLFDPANREKPLSGVEYWIKHLNAATWRHAEAGRMQAGDPLASPAPTLLIAARADRGTPTMTDAEIQAFCQRHGIAGYVRTSARENTGIDELMARIKAAIPWHRLTPTVTTDTFKRIKDHVLRLKERGGDTTDVLLPADALRDQLQATDNSWRFTDPEMLTAVQHLANHGYVALIQRADGDRSVLLASDLLVNLASSVVLEARRHERGLGMVDEARLLNGEYRWPELVGLTEEQRHLLLNEAARLFLSRNLCFRETVNYRTSLVFPSLINEKRPTTSAAPIDDVTYRVTGEVETVYPALVVQLGYTSTFSTEHHWQTQAEYEFEAGQSCGFRQTAEGNGEIELVLSYAPTAREDTRLLFRALFERFLRARRVQVSRLPAVICPGGHRQQRTVVLDAIDRKLPHFFCNECGQKLITPKVDDIGIPPEGQAEAVRTAAETATRRTDYEVAILWVKSFRQARGDSAAPSCFISYAWGDPGHERWVEDLADHLLQADVGVILDRWHCRPGTDLSAFIERIDAADFICATGTPRYRQKYEVKDQDPVVRAELRLINDRHMKRDDHHDTVIPLWRAGSQKDSFPPLLRTSVAVDMREDRDFLSRLFELVLTIHRIPFEHPMARQHRRAIAGDDKR